MNAKIIEALERPDMVCLFWYGKRLLRHLCFSQCVPVAQQVPTDCILVATDVSQLHSMDRVARHLGYEGLVSIEQMTIDDALDFCRRERIGGICYAERVDEPARIIYCSFD